MPNSRRDVLKRLGAAGATTGAIIAGSSTAGANSTVSHSPREFQIAEQDDVRQEEIDVFRKFEKDTSNIKEAYEKHTDELEDDLEAVGVTSVPTLDQAESVAVLPRRRDDEVTPRIVADFERKHSFLAIIDPVDEDVSVHLETGDGNYRIDSEHGVKRKTGCTDECECTTNSWNCGPGTLIRWRVCRYPDGSVSREFIGVDCGCTKGWTPC